jgi:GNAT superfamily N-acetyltransferase
VCEPAEARAVDAADRLRAGVAIADRSGAPVFYRYLDPTDDIGLITDLLHEAYAPLALAGMRFFASHQSVDATAKRLSRGETVVALDASDLIGIVTLGDLEKTSGSPFYDRPDVASFGQFAVRPNRQFRGIGGTLLALVEERATERGVGHLALDTSERAVHLIDYYQRKGYAFVEHVQWPDVNYRSVVLAKALRRDGAPSPIIGSPCSPPQDP